MINTRTVMPLDRPIITVTESQKIISSWTKAGTDLGIKIVAPFSLGPSDDSTQTFPIFVPFFGSRRGTIILFDFDQTVSEDLAKDGFGVSTLGHSYIDYERTLFVDTLEDWGFFGPKEYRPDWYTHRDF